MYHDEVEEHKAVLRDKALPVYQRAGWTITRAVETIWAGATPHTNTSAAVEHSLLDANSAAVVKWLMDRQMQWELGEPVKETGCDFIVEVAPNPLATLYSGEDQKKAVAIADAVTTAARALLEAADAENATTKTAQAVVGQEVGAALATVGAGETQVSFRSSL